PLSAKQKFSRFLLVALNITLRINHPPYFSVANLSYLTGCRLLAPYIPSFYLSEGWMPSRLTHRVYALKANYTGFSALI
ncbi:MAG TPA: hypothetical protein VEA37_07755, partial [Flavobacterium sp.]|nr:hypothetical protein [Flavobacterium sp.]